jgi:branched-chain amino acid transport system substrate-binding protein
MLVAVALNAAPAGAASAKGTPILIGDICSCTGPLASTALLSTPVANAWVSWVNAHGGLNGHPVQLFFVDDLTNPGTSITDAAKMIQSDHVAAIFDNSNVDSAWLSQAVSAGVPVIGGVNSDLGFTSPDMFPPGATLNYGIADEDLPAVKAGVKTEAILYCVEAAACANTTHTAGLIGSRAGIKVVYTVGISYSAPSFAAQCLAAKQSGAQSLETADAAVIVQKAADNCALQGWHPVEVTNTSELANPDAADPNFATMTASSNNIPWFVHNAATKDFYSAIGQYAPSVQTNPNFGEEVIFQWANGVLLQHAIKAAAPSASANVTAAVIKKGLYHLPAGDTLGGLTAQPMHFTKGVPANFSCAFFIGVKASQFIWSNNHKALCAPLMAPGHAEGGPLLKKK